MQGCKGCLFKKKVYKKRILRQNMFYWWKQITQGIFLHNLNSQA
jgi:hypothetical protein